MEPRHSSHILTVCSARDLNPLKIEAAAGYVRGSRLLPLAVRKTGISYSTTMPLRAVVIEIESTTELSRFREELQRTIDAAEPPSPHISLLYTIDVHGRQPSWCASVKAFFLSGVAKAERHERDGRRAHFAQW